VSNAVAGGGEQVRHECNAALRKTLQRNRDAVQNALTMPWSNGQTEGQISRRKTLKRSMYGRAGADLLRVRLLPL
jgi:transposase